MYNLYDRVWEIELENAKIMNGYRSKTVNGLLRFIAMPFTDKAVKASDASLVQHDDNRHVAAASIDKCAQLIPDVPKDKEIFEVVWTFSG